VSEPGALEVVDRRGVDAVVLAEHEAAREGGLVLGHAAFERGLGAVADAVGKTCQAATAAPGEGDPLALEDRADTVRAQIAGLPRVGLAQHPIRPDLAPHRQVGDRLRRLDQQPAVGGAHPHRDLPAGTARDRGHEAGCRDASLRRALQRAGVDRPQPLASGNEAGRACGQRDQHQPRPRRDGRRIAGAWPRRDQRRRDRSERQRKPDALRRRERRSHDARGSAD
jgi:hypothetical protein